MAFRLMKNGNPWNDYNIVNESGLKIIGDKKPLQQVEPFISDWTGHHFDNFKYIHIVRHPYDFVCSVPNNSEMWSSDIGGIWGKTASDILKIWVKYETMVLREVEKNRYPILTIKFEDFCDKPWKCLENIWNFLELDVPQNLKYKIKNKDRFGINKCKKYPLTEIQNLSTELEEIMKIYDYKK